MVDKFLIACKSCRRQYDVTGIRKGEHVRCLCGELLKVPERPVHEARVLHCSACGGKLRDRALRCDYCGAEITTTERNLGLVCPECFARLPVNALFCSECGIKIEPECIRALPSSATCPRCRRSLVLREAPGTRYTECSGCGGIWLDADYFERVVQDKDVASLGGILPAAADAARGEPPVDTVKYIPCPVCSALMHRKNFAGCSGVVIDWCRGHGFWFDAQELGKVVSFVRSGGMDKARRLQIQRAKDELERIQDRKKAAAAGPVWDAPSTRQEPAWDLMDLIGSLVGYFR